MDLFEYKRKVELEPTIDNINALLIAGMRSGKGLEILNFIFDKFEFSRRTLQTSSWLSCAYHIINTPILAYNASQGLKNSLAKPESVLYFFRQEIEELESKQQEIAQLAKKIMSIISRQEDDDQVFLYPQGWALRSGAANQIIIGVANFDAERRIEDLLAQELDQSESDNVVVHVDSQIEECCDCNKIIDLNEYAIGVYVSSGILCCNCIGQPDISDIINYQHHRYDELGIRPEVAYWLYPDPEEFFKFKGILDYVYRALNLFSVRNYLIVSGEPLRSEGLLERPVEFWLEKYQLSRIGEKFLDWFDFETRYLDEDEMAEHGKLALEKALKIEELSSIYDLKELADTIELED